MERLDTRDLAGRWGVDRKTIYRMKERGQLPMEASMPGEPAEWALTDIEALEIEGLTTDVEGWRERIYMLIEAANYLYEVEAGPVDPAVKDMVRCGRTVMENIIIPIRHRLKLANSILKMNLELGVALDGEQTASTEGYAVSLAKLMLTSDDMPERLTPPQIAEVIERVLICNDLEQPIGEKLAALVTIAQTELLRPGTRAEKAACKAFKSKVKRAAKKIAKDEN